MMVGGVALRFGDRVALGGGCEGIVVADLDRGEFLDVEAEVWRFLTAGIMIVSSCAGPIHYEVPDEDLAFLERPDTDPGRLPASNRDGGALDGSDDEV